MRLLCKYSDEHMKIPSITDLGYGEIAINGFDGQMYIRENRTYTTGENKVIPIKRKFHVHEVADIAARDALYESGSVLYLDIVEYTNANGKLQRDALLSEQEPVEWQELEIDE